MPFFRASTQYGDWKGTASADDARPNLNDYLTNHGLIRESEFLLAASLYVEEEFVCIHAFAIQGNTFDAVKDDLARGEDPILVRKISVELTTREFLNLFKRFDVMLTHRGLELDEREYSEIA